MTAVLTVNTGSTSVKLAAFDTAPSGTPARLWDEQHHGSTLQPVQVLRSLSAKLASPPPILVHRVVHGGTRFTVPTRIDASVEQAIGALSPMAPLHNPQALRWIGAAREIWGERTQQWAVFDTAYFARMPRVASEYALAPAIGIERGVRRYGFHGLAHESLWRRWCTLNPQLEAGGRLISLQLGGGCSIAATLHGSPLDTSMGFSPLEGLVMATRCGDLDPAVIPYLERSMGLSGDAVIEALEKRAGLAGLSGTDGDIRQLLRARSSEAEFALDLYCYRIRKYVGAYLAVLGGCDGIVFGGGVGEHVPAVRDKALQGLEFLGIELDPARNGQACGEEALISAADRIKVHVLHSDEEAILAAAGARALAGFS